MSQGNDFDAVRAYLDFWGEHPRRGKALAALERIEAALRPFATMAEALSDWAGQDDDAPFVRPIISRDGRGRRVTSYAALTKPDFDFAAARFAETAEGEGT